MSYRILSWHQVPPADRAEIRKVDCAALLPEVTPLLAEFGGEARISDDDDGDFVVFSVPDPTELGDAHPAVLALQAAGYPVCCGLSEEGEFHSDVWPRTRYPESERLLRLATERVRRAELRARRREVSA